MACLCTCRTCLCARLCTRLCACLCTCLCTYSCAWLCTYLYFFLPVSVPFSVPASIFFLPIPVPRSVPGSAPVPAPAPVHACLCTRPRFLTSIPIAGVLALEWPHTTQTFFIFIFRQGRGGPPEAQGRATREWFDRAEPRAHERGPPPFLAPVFFCAGACKTCARACTDMCIDMGIDALGVRVLVGRYIVMATYYLWQHIIYGNILVMARARREGCSSAAI